MANTATGILALNSHMSEENKLNIARMYFQCGNMSQVARDLNVRYVDILAIAREDWFAEEIRSLEREANALLKVKLTRLMDSTLNALEDRLENGDTVVVGLGTKLIPIAARDLAGIAKVVFEKKKEIQEGVYGETTKESKRLLALAASLKAKNVEIFENETGKEIAE